ncbi:2-oxo acid dehydrogenase subunit E2 [Arthrobacter sp. Sa2BUA2]|uniref:Dihydrolipoamide acetyltransferase component of pyruvate dehydrogenase complex n=1 Tax=Arthrobacter pullicola TaxID=2762224 RepID=A0ABR8YJP0_9MICC|nr:dihydrolipoamide acetyltransferase family protein [Arthrobacter pullicola]MBD8044445.1 2-oxo acid dehydrogenase subunit E2 [Arthrobacter pullicola]
MRTFLLPDLGEGLTDAELVNWLVAEGDTIAVDQPVAEVETAKSLVEVPSPFAGIVEALHGAAGESIDVGKPLISVRTTAAAGLPEPAATPAGDTAAVPAPAGAPDAAGEAYRQEERAGSGNVLIGYGTPGNHGTNRRTRAPRPGRAGGSALPPAAAASAVVPAAVQAVAVHAATAALEAPRCISPLVRRLAREAGLSLTALSGSGADGLILRRDVEQAIAGASTHPPMPSRTPAPAPASGAAVDTAPGTDPRSGLGITSRTSVKGLRRTVAANLSASRTEIPEATVWVDVDATALLELRAGLKRRDPDNTPGLMAFLARFVLAGLRRFPELNTRYVRNGTGEAELLAFDGVNLGFAAQTERGLMVPSIRHAEKLSARELDAEIRRLTAAARSGAATPAELTSGTFTLNNYGVFGVDGSAAIINYPESAILGIGRIIDKPWVVDGELAVRKLTELTLVFDHRVCDGGTAGGFLRYVADAIENPGSVLADL